MKKRNVNIKKPYGIDLKAEYLIPMRKKKDRFNRDAESDIVKTTIRYDISSDSIFVDSPDGYESYAFAAYLFDWYLYTGYLKKVEE